MHVCICLGVCTHACICLCVRVHIYLPLCASVCHGRHVWFSDGPSCADDDMCYLPCRSWAFRGKHGGDSRTCQCGLPNASPAPRPHGYILHPHSGPTKKTNLLIISGAIMEASFFATVKRPATLGRQPGPHTGGTPTETLVETPAGTPPSLEFIAKYIVTEWT